MTEFDYDHEYPSHYSECDGSCSPHFQPYRLGGNVFLMDHLYRECNNHTVYVKESKTAVTVWMRECDAKELMSDAEHYAGEPDYDLGLRMSARGTILKLLKQGVERTTSYYIKNIPAKVSK